MSYIIFLDIFVGVLFLIFLGLGLISKLKKSIISFISFVIPAIALLILINPLTKSVLESEINFESIFGILSKIGVNTSGLPVKGSIHGILVKAVGDNLASSGIVIDADMEALIGGLAHCVARIGVYIGGIIVVIFASIIISIVLNILCSIFKVSKVKKPLYGLIVRAINFVCVFVIVFLPIYGGVASINAICDEIVTTVEASENESIDVEGIKNFQTNIQGSFVQEKLLSMFKKEDSLPADANWFNKKVLTFDVETSSGTKSVAIYDELESIKGSLPSILQIYNSSKGEGLDIASLNVSDVEAIVDVTTKSTIVRLAFPSLSKFLVSEVSNSLGITISTSEVENWDEEIPAIGTILVDAVKLAQEVGLDLNNMLSTLESDESAKELLSNLVNDMAKSTIFRTAMVPLINKALESYSPDLAVTITEADEARISDWGNEMNILLSIVTNALDLFGDGSETFDYTHLDADKIRNMMLEAANGVISCKLIGGALNNLFGEKVATDFTVKENMIASAETVYNLIKISNSVSTGHLDLDNVEDVKEAVQAIADLVQAEQEKIEAGETGAITSLVNGLAGEILTEKELESIEPEVIVEAASLVSDLLDEYTAFMEEGTHVPQDFNLDLISPELKEQIQNSSFADLIAGFLF